MNAFSILKCLHWIPSLFGLEEVRPGAGHHDRREGEDQGKHHSVGSHYDFFEDYHKRARSTSTMIALSLESHKSWYLTQGATPSQDRCSWISLSTFWARYSVIHLYVSSPNCHDVTSHRNVATTLSFVGRALTFYESFVIHNWCPLSIHVLFILHCRHA